MAPVRLTAGGERRRLSILLLAALPVTPLRRDLHL